MDPRLFKALKYGTPLLLVAFAAWLIWAPPARVGYAPEQPIAYRHDIHAGDPSKKTFDGRDQYGIDCRYCHTGVEVSKKAGVPSMNTCMNCHEIIGYGKAGVMKLRKYYEQKKPLDWVRVHNMPDHVRFPHAPHIKQLHKPGEHISRSCVPCHGEVAAMKVVTQVESLNMGFCVNCHRDYRNTVEYKHQGVNINCNTCHY